MPIKFDGTRVREQRYQKTAGLQNLGIASFPGITRWNDGMMDLPLSNEAAKEDPQLCKRHQTEPLIPCRLVISGLQTSFSVELTLLIALNSHKVR